MFLSHSLESPSINICILSWKLKASHADVTLMSPNIANMYITKSTHPVSGLMILIRVNCTHFKFAFTTSDSRTWSVCYQYYCIIQVWSNTSTGGGWCWGTYAIIVLRSFKIITLYSLQLPEAICLNQELSYVIIIENSQGYQVTKIGPNSQVGPGLVREEITAINLKENETYSLIVGVETSSQNATSYKHYFSEFHNNCSVHEWVIQ